MGGQIRWADGQMGKWANGQIEVGRPGKARRVNAGGGVWSYV